MRTAIWLLAGVFFIASASAKENYKEKSFNADTRDKFATIAEGIRDEMKEGGRYEYMKPDERRTIEQKLEEITTIFGKTESVAAMQQDDKIKLFNAQESINSILTKRDRDRVICENKTKLGSHIRETTCHTYAQEVQARQETQKQMSDWKVMGCAGTSSGRGNATQPPIACSYRTNGDGGMGSGSRGGH